MIGEGAATQPPDDAGAAEIAFGAEGGIDGAGCIDDADTLAHPEPVPRPVQESRALVAGQIRRPVGPRRTEGRKRITLDPFELRIDRLGLARDARTACMAVVMGDRGGAEEIVLPPGDPEAVLIATIVATPAIVVG